MSPEQAAGDEALTGRSDQYALAALVYEALAGSPAVHGRQCPRHPGAEAHGDAGPAPIGQG